MEAWPEPDQSMHGNHAFSPVSTPFFRLPTKVTKVRAGAVVVLFPVSPFQTSPRSPSRLCNRTIHLSWIRHPRLARFHVLLTLSQIVFHSASPPRSVLFTYQLRYYFISIVPASSSRGACLSAFAHPNPEAETTPARAAEVQRCRRQAHYSTALSTRVASPDLRPAAITHDLRPTTWPSSPTASSGFVSLSPVVLDQPLPRSAPGSRLLVCAACPAACRLRGCTAVEEPEV
jgi:hypothetical protein